MHLFLNAFSFLLLSTLCVTSALGDDVEFNLLTGPSIKAEQFKSFEGESGGRLGVDRRLNLFTTFATKGSESPWSYGIGAYFEHDFNKSSIYVGLDSAGTPQVDAGKSRVSNTLWLGPYAQWSHDIFSIGVLYVFYGRRWDTAIQESVLKTDRWRAWAIYPGLTFALSSETSLQLSLEYRYLYYRTHLFYGNQSIRPLIGFKIKL